MWYLEELHFSNIDDIHIYNRREFDVAGVKFRVTFQNIAPYVLIDFWVSDEMSVVKVESLRELVTYSSQHIDRSCSKVRKKDIKRDPFVKILNQSLDDYISCVMNVAPVTHKGRRYKNFYEVYGFTIRSYSLLLQGVFWGMVLDDPCLYKTLRCRYTNYKGVTGRSVKDVLKHYGDFKQAYDDGLDNVVPIMLALTGSAKSYRVSPDECKRVFGKKVWKTIHSNSLHRNRMLANGIEYNYNSLLTIDCTNTGIELKHGFDTNIMDVPSWMLSTKQNIRMSRAGSGHYGEGWVRVVNRIYTGVVRKKGWYESGDYQFPHSNASDDKRLREHIRSGFYHHVSGLVTDSIDMASSCRERIESGSVGNIDINRDIRRLVSNKTIHKVANYDELVEYHDKLTDLTNKIKILGASDEPFDVMIKNTTSGVKHTLGDVEELLKDECEAKGCSFKLLKSSRDYVIEGLEMKHCVAGYDDRASKGRYMTFSITDSGGERSTLGLGVIKKEDDSDDDHFALTGIYLNQHYGKRNGNISVEASEVGQEILNVLTKHYC